MFLDLVNVSCFKDGRSLPILDSVSLSIKRGVFLGIVGPVGSGKTRLLEVMSGFVSVHSGEVAVDPTLRKCIMFENSEDIFSQETVYDEIALGLKHIGCSENEIRERAEALLGQVFLSPAFMEHSPFSLSDGEKRRLALAIFLAMEPDILFLDEPLQGLDLRNRETILVLLKKLREDRGLTVVMVSRSLRDMFYYTESVLVLDMGRVVYMGSVENLVDSEKTVEYLIDDFPASVVLYRRLVAAGVIERNTFVASETGLIEMMGSILREKNRVAK